MSAPGVDAYEDGGAISDDATTGTALARDRPVGVDEPGSVLLELVARDRGLTVRRLAGDLVACDDGTRTVLFRGLAGAACTTVAQVLCGNYAWLRRHLANRGLATVPTRLVDPGDADFAQLAAETLGMPVTIRLAGAAGGRTAGIATDTVGFHEIWRTLVEEGADRRSQVVLERRPGGQAIDVAVVDGTVIAQEPAAGAAAAGERAVRAITAIPGVAYGSVRILSDPRARPGVENLLIDTVDPTMHTWARSADATAREIAAAILGLEFAPSDRLGTAG